MSKLCSVSCRICASIAEFIGASAEPWVLYLIMECVQYWFRFRKCMLEIMNVRFLGVQRRKTSRDNWSCALINSKPQHPASPPSGKPWPFELLRLACSSPSTPSHQGTFNTRFLLARLVYINDTFDNSFEALFECDIRSQRWNPVLKNVLTPQNKEKKYGYFQQHQKINPI